MSAINDQQNGTKDRRNPELTARLAKLIAQAGSDEKFAEMLGRDAFGKLNISRPTVGNWRKGQVPYPDTLQEIARRTGVSHRWLMHGEGDEKEIAIRDEPRIYGLPHSGVVRTMEAPKMVEDRAETAKAPQIKTMPEHHSLMWEKILEIASARMDDATLAATLSAVYSATDLSEDVRRRATSRLIHIITRREQASATKSAPKNRR